MTVHLVATQLKLRQQNTSDSKAATFQGEDLQVGAALVF